MSVVADDGGPGDGPPRMVEREAPSREPQVLEQSVTPEGLTNAVIELPAEADAYIASEWPSQNFGADALYLGYNLYGDANFGAERILLRFDVLGNVPDGAVINDARLRLRLNWSDPPDDEPMGNLLRRLASPWEEATVTWDKEPAWAEVRVESEVGSARDWYEWELTELVADWVASAHDNHGLELIGDERVQQRERAFYSRETDGDFYPRLVVDYTDFRDSEPPTVSVNALPEYVCRSFGVSWSGKDPGGSGIASYDVQYRVDGGDWSDWLVDVDFSSADFASGRDGRLYEFRARAEDRAGNVEPFGGPEASTTVDAQPPTSLVAPLPRITDTTSFTVSWSGYDDGSGIQYYDIRYRLNDGDWIPWQQETLATEAPFTVLDGDGFYEFEARAVDNLGLKEAFTGQAEAAIIVDAEPPFIEPRAWLPFVVHGY